MIFEIYCFDQMFTQALAFGADNMVKTKQTHWFAMYGELQVNVMYYKAKNITM